MHAEMKCTIRRRDSRIVVNVYRAGETNEEGDEVIWTLRGLGLVVYDLRSPEHVARDRDYIACVGGI